MARASIKIHFHSSPKGTYLLPFPRPPCRQMGRARMAWRRMILILGEQITNIEGWPTDRASERAGDRASEPMRKHNGRKGRGKRGREAGNNGASKRQNFPPCPLLASSVRPSVSPSLPLHCHSLRFFPPRSSHPDPEGGGRANMNDGGARGRARAPPHEVFGARDCCH